MLKVRQNVPRPSCQAGSLTPITLHLRAANICYFSSPSKTRHSSMAGQNVKPQPYRSYCAAAICCLSSSTMSMAVRLACQPLRPKPYRRYRAAAVCFATSSTMAAIASSVGHLFFSLPGWQGMPDAISRKPPTTSRRRCGTSFANASGSAKSQRQIHVTLYRQISGTGNFGTPYRELLAPYCIPGLIALI